MRDRFHLWVSANATWPRIGFLAACCTFLMGAFAIRENVLTLGDVRDHGGVPDTRLWYTPDDVATFLTATGKQGRDLRSAPQLTLDCLFPVPYSSLLCFIFASLWPPALARWLIWLPVLAGAADLGENSLLTSLAWDFTGRANNLAWVAAGLTATKFGALTLSLLAAFVGFVAW